MPEKLVRQLEEIQAAREPPFELLDEFRLSYRESTREARLSFFSLLLTRMEVAPDAIEAPLRAVLAQGSGDPVGWTSLLTDLRRKLESPRMRAFRRFLNASGGLKFLLDLRADVLTASIDLQPIDEEIAYLFTSWFQYGFLFLQEITQDSSYRQIRFLKNHDMVHPMASLEEMSNRLGEDRRSFALYHRAMPEEPIVFIEAALTRRIPRSIHEILDGSRKRAEASPDTAIFYSINNAQNGLVGLGLGKLLIFEVVEAIKRHHPQIQTFATLSPITGFLNRYLNPILAGNDGPFRMKRKDLAQHFSERIRRRVTARRGHGERDFPTALAELLLHPRWIEDHALVADLEKPLTRIAFFYLTEEKDAAGKPLNPVAAFHLGNGARLNAKSVYYGANRTERGLLDSCGIMVSYVYSSTWLHGLRRSARAMLPWQS
ncbi:MAG: malonyl-CoA decarboxylase domain-containing protein [Vicinamibacteria bacterium]